MRRSTVLLVAALALAACHRSAADVTLDADADARNATEAKIDADLAAADAAARAPLPHEAPRTIAPTAPAATEPAAAAPDESEDTNEA